MKINSYKRGAAAVIAIALAAAAFSGCDKNTENVQSQITDTASSTSSDKSEVTETDDSALTETFDIAEEDPNAELILVEEGYDDDETFIDYDFETLEKDGFSYYLMDDEAYITEYNGSEKTVAVPEKFGSSPVKTLNFDIFSFNDTVRKIIVPDTVENLYAGMTESSVESIEVSENNKKYSTVDGVLFNKDKTTLICYPCGKSGDYTIPDTVVTVEQSAFYGCSKLKVLTISKNVKSIDGYCFGECRSIAEYRISGGSENYSVKDGILYSKSGDKLVLYPTSKKGEFKMPDTVKSVGAYAFAYNENITKIELSPELAVIEEEAFESCTSLAEVKFGNKLETIDNGAFCDCESLAKVELPESVKIIGSYAFINCLSLEEINIPANVSELAFDTFSYCDMLGKVSVDKNNKNYVVKDNVIYDKDITQIVLYPSGREGDYEIPDSVQSISSDTFYSCPSLTKITVPASVTNIDDFAFQSCYSLEAIEVSEKNSNYASVGGILYDKSKTKILYIPSAMNGEAEITSGVTEIGTELFFNGVSITSFKVDSENKNYTSVDGALFSKDKTVLVKVPTANDGEYKVPDGVKEIGVGAFYSCYDITSVTIPDGVESIMGNAFEASGITKVYVPKSVKEIGMAAFGYGGELTDIYYSGSESDWKNISIDIENDNLEDGTVTIHYNSK